MHPIPSHPLRWDTSRSTAILRYPPSDVNRRGTVVCPEHGLLPGTIARADGFLIHLGPSSRVQGRGRPGRRTASGPAERNGSRPDAQGSSCTSPHICGLYEAAMPTIGLFKGLPPIEPWNWALPNEKMPPSLATVQ